ncbi:glycoside hydrolase family 64 protein [Trichodelitschia bisporula]|uniref:Glycoside hydrolase family 64 protein n=1 Tax=Trichodelitschia bisporula TaxID=703511 RepID=A0A6G1I8A1_9PEZI|nr:glycoside hydrolase family 64 protein [Trichodelitschia bisporula]
MPRIFKSLRRQLLRLRLLPSKSKAQKPVQQHNVQDTSTTAAPKPTKQQTVVSPYDTGTTLSIALTNNTTSANVYAFITGTAISSRNSLFLLQADGQTPYYPLSPMKTTQPLQVNCAIPLGAPGNVVTVTIPQIVGGRIWFSIDAPLTFLLNPGPALVEPSVTNPSDPNLNINWGFAEFTFTSAQLYANISYVDFVSIPIALTLETADGTTKSISGLNRGGLDSICEQLQQQSQADGVDGWADLVVKYGGRNLRALSPNTGMVVNQNAFAGYWDPYVNHVWSQYSTQQLTVNAQSVNVTGGVSSSSNQLVLGNESFDKPSTQDIFSCNTGVFATGSSATRNVLIPQLAASFNRTTLLASNYVPASQSTYYENTITNHYSRIVHSENADGKGYAFPYDDAGSPDGPDQSGYVNDPNPRVLTVTVGQG